MEGRCDMGENVLTTVLDKLRTEMREERSSEYTMLNNSHKRAVCKARVSLYEHVIKLIEETVRDETGYQNRK